MITQELPRFSWMILGTVLIVILLVFYICQVTQITKAGFFISNYEKQITEFSQESQSLETNFPRLNSLANLETILNNLDYEKIEKIHYLRVLGATVVAK